MKKLFVVTLVLISVAVQAQKTKSAKSTTAASGRALRNLTDSASYALGLSVAKFYKQQGLKNLNTTLIAKAISDVQANRQPLLNDEKANETIMFFVDPKLKTTIAEGNKFLAQNKTKAGVKITASGLQYEILKDAQGAKPRAIDTVVVNYRGTLANGTEFDNSY